MIFWRVPNGSTGIDVQTAWDCMLAPHNQVMGHFIFASRLSTIGASGFCLSVPCLAKGAHFHHGLWPKTAEDTTFFKAGGSERYRRRFRFAKTEAPPRPEAEAPLGTLTLILMFDHGGRGLMQLAGMQISSLKCMLHARTCFVAVRATRLMSCPGRG